MIRRISNGVNKHTTLAIVIAAVFVGGAFYYASPRKENSLNMVASSALAAKFEILSQNGNSQCSGAFKNSIASMPASARLQGSCCSPMNLHRYTEQVEGLKKFKSAAGQNIPEIPDDPYDIDAGLAKKLIAYYDTELTPEEQQAYDYAMMNSNEKGPCCCKCWRWYVYGGLGKYLIQNYGFTPLEARTNGAAVAHGDLPLTGFTGEQVKEVWNLSDGCGGEGDHVQQ